ncbi:hypothetical protein PHYSODRAFT_518215, partial [Phytophthora sojae]
YIFTQWCGMPPHYHSTIAIVHATMSAVHTARALLMIAGSLWQRSLCFTPCCIKITSTKVYRCEATSSIRIFASQNDETGSSAVMWPLAELCVKEVFAKCSCETLFCSNIT